ncbi:MAG: class I SAM-dependent methyltransferase [Armatimonadetes bacterium]|nr:class I SAM-dependent methyltransferase [Armatimonadota bacterium]
MNQRGFLRSLEQHLAGLKGVIRDRSPGGRRSERDIVAQFHALYYEAADVGKTWASTSWLGVPAQKCPLDLWLYQEIIHEVKPDLIIESGTADGGSALFLASVCDLLDCGRIITIDIRDSRARPQHARIRYLRGSSTSPEILDTVRQSVRASDRVMVILDSDHRKAHVLAEFNAYAPLVSKGSYLIVEDTNINGHPVAPGFGPGPMEAVEEFLQQHRGFVVDERKHKFLLTFNPRGYLKKIR